MKVHTDKQYRQTMATIREIASLLPEHDPDTPWCMTRREHELQHAPDHVRADVARVIDQALNACVDHARKNPKLHRSFTPHTQPNRRMRRKLRPDNFWFSEAIKSWVADSRRARIEHKENK